MNFRRSSVLCVAAALAVLTAAGCGSSSGGDDPTAGTGPTTVDSEPASTGEPVASDETDSTEPNAPPAEVIPSTLVFFDADGATPSMRGAPVMIADETGLVEFAGDFVDADPELGTAAAEALDEGKVLVGGVVSSSCFPAGGGQLAATPDEVRLLPTDWDPDESVNCYRAVNSIALLAVYPADLPDDRPITGN